MLSLGDGTPEGVSGKDISRAAEGGDPVALAAFSEIGRWLGPRHGRAGGRASIRAVS